MDGKALSSAILKFSARFIIELEKKTSVVFSPLSAELVLALLALGASDATHEEILKELGFSNDDEVRASFSTLSSKLKSINGVTLNVANKVYLREDLDLEPKMQEDAVQVFDSDIERVDFTDNTTCARINEWVESKTNNKIKNAFPEGAFNDSTQLVLVNAIYFKGSWLKPFDSRHTTDQVFHLDSKRSITVPMMTHQSDGYYKYAQLDRLQAELLSLPYEGEEASMLFVLPNDVNGLDEVLRKLADGYDLIATMEALKETTADVSLPKFKVETEIDLSKVIQKLGIKSIYSKGLDKILRSKESITVSKAVQKACIEVNEEGTEAAAITYVPTVFCSSPHFKADHPFLYALVVPGNTVLFVGLYRGDGSLPQTTDKSHLWSIIKNIFKRKK